MDETHAWFCVTEKSVNVYDLNKHPFIGNAQFFLAKELIIIPLWSFIKLANQGVSPNDVDIIIFFNSARCGSTLACQMFNKLPKTRFDFFFKFLIMDNLLSVLLFRSLSEPWILTNANVTMSYRELSYNFEDVIRAGILLQCKQSVENPFERVVLKPCISSTSVVRHFVFC